MARASSQNSATPSAASVSSSQASDDAQVDDQVAQALRARRAARTAQRPTPSLHPQFKSKAVCELICKHCDALVCHRGMQAILLGDVRVQLFSTDVPILGRVQLVNDDYTTRNCRCRIRDVACLTCGNIIGYTVTQPCDSCLNSCNNGHLSMFVQEGVYHRDRLDPATNSSILYWCSIPDIETDNEIYGIYRQNKKHRDGALQMTDLLKTPRQNSYRYENICR